MSENNLDTPQEETPESHTGVAQLLSTGVDERKTGEQFKYEPSGWATLYNICGWICIVVGLAVLFIGIGEAEELWGSEKTAALIAAWTSFGILIGAALSSFLCGFLINTLTQIRDNTRYLLLETHKQNKRKPTEPPEPEEKASAN
ncbi:hypothetical protein OAM00_03010 [Verrucomicrobia bacterium]|nr:hypothetical protein [Verrucomicrobiota bacterium]